MSSDIQAISSAYYKMSSNRANSDPLYTNNTFLCSQDITTKSWLLVLQAEAKRENKPSACLTKGWEKKVPKNQGKIMIGVGKYHKKMKL